MNSFGRVPFSEFTDTASEIAAQRIHSNCANAKKIFSMTFTDTRIQHLGYKDISTDTTFFEEFRSSEEEFIQGLANLQSDLVYTDCSIC